MHKIIFYVPESHLDKVKEAAFAAGAGRLGGYERCCWQSKGQAEYLPKKGSHPYEGDQGKLSITEEYKVETLCDDHLVEKVIEAIKATHPYEEPGYEAWKMSHP
jgi:hypothetical protein